VSETEEIKIYNGIKSKYIEIQIELVVNSPYAKVFKVKK
jgi:hypothetical protein